MKAVPLYLTLVFAVLAALGCNQETCLPGDVSVFDYVQQSDSIRSQVTALIDENGDSTGLYYYIQSPGDNVKPTVTDSITFTYEGRTTNDNLFGQSGDTPNTNVLSALIEGWQLGIPLIGQGGSITLYIPAYLGYAASQAGDICPNSDLIFDVNLLSVN